MDWGRVAQERLEEIAACSLQGAGVTRFPFTTQHRHALDLIRSWMESAGLSSSLDAAGTLVGHAPGNGPTVLLGSHQDSVRNAGKYDGIMGIALACLALESLRAQGVILDYPVEVLAFADEEGVRFPTALLGPRALAGSFSPDTLDMMDEGGTLLREALKAFGGNPDTMIELARSRSDTRCYLELHIEQGPVLEASNAPVGVVTGICGIERNKVAFHGETGHAGTVPMLGRADALVAAADFVSAVHDVAHKTDDVRATVGTCRVLPGVANGIPDLAELTLEIRAPDDAVREEFSANLKAETEAAALHRGVHVEMKRTYLQTAVPCAPDICRRLSRAIMAVGHDGEMLLPSGATHDASAMADLCDIGMLFVRCRGGVSHRPEEYASAEDMGVAIDVLAHTLMELNE